MGGNKFMFATGMENSYPTIRLAGGTTKRVDEMEKTNHYARWQTDWTWSKSWELNFCGMDLHTTKRILVPVSMTGVLRMKRLTG